MKKVVIILILIAIVVAIAMLAPPITSKSLSTIAPISQSSSIPTPKPTPVVNITKDSNLSEEAKKLNVPEYESDYSSLDQTLLGF